MFIERYGSGNQCYFGLHGWGGGHRTFLPLSEFLPETATLYAVDLPGCGRSRAPQEWSAESIAQEVARAIDQTGVAKLTIIGNCSGAIIGLLASLHLGERVERFILIDPFAYMPWYFRLFLAPGWGRYAYLTAFANPLGRWITNLSLKPRRTKTSDLTATFSDADHIVTHRYLAMLAEIKGTDRFRGIEAPIDICYGRRTFKAVKESARMWKSIWPQARLFELEGAGHLPIEEATQQLSRIIFSNSQKTHTEQSQQEADLIKTAVTRNHTF